MKTTKIYIYLFVLITGTFLLSGCTSWDETEIGSLRIVTNRGGQTLGYDTGALRSRI